MSFEDASLGRRVVKVSTNDDEFAPEVNARATLRASGLPVAEPLSYQPKAPSTLTLPWVEGDALSADHPTSAHERVGALLARVHQIPAIAEFGGNTTWSSWMQGWLSTACAWWESVRPHQAVPFGVLSDRLAELSPAMDADAEGSILFDGRPEHFVVDDSLEIQMIDVEQLKAGDPAMDVGVLAVWIPEAVPAIVSGFAAVSGPVDETFQARVEFYTLLRTLAAAQWHLERLHDAAVSNALLDQAHVLAVVPLPRRHV